MKKLLMMTTAIAGIAMLSAPASAAIDLELGGYFSGYVIDADDDATNVHNTEFRRSAAISMAGETTLDNGTTIGAMVDFDIDEDGAETDTATIDAVYAYAQGGWGRVNLGKEDGAAFLLQVAAPSADENIDGVSIGVQGFDFANTSHATNSAVPSAVNALGASELEYAHYDFGDAERLTYMTPKYNGFQAGISYGFTDKTAGNVVVMGGNADDGDYEDLVEVAASYEGEYEGYAFNFGAGYSTAELEADDADVAGLATGYQTRVQTGSLDTYNLGANVMFKEFSLGASYGVSEVEVSLDGDITAGTGYIKSDVEQTTYVIGAAYDNGPYHVGVSYLNREAEQDAIADVQHGISEEVDRFTIGGGYSFGPGITFRGSVAWGETDITNTDADSAALLGAVNADSNEDFTQIAIGTDIQF